MGSNLARQTAFEKWKSPCRKRSPAKGVWQKSDDKSDRSIEKVTKKRPKESRKRKRKVIKLLLPTSFCGTLRKNQNLAKQRLVILLFSPVDSQESVLKVRKLGQFHVAIHVTHVAIRVSKVHLGNGVHYGETSAMRNPPPKPHEQIVPQAFQADAMEKSGKHVIGAFAHRTEYAAERRWEENKG